MKANRYKIIAGLAALVSLAALTIQLIKVPTFMVSSVYLTAMFIVALLAGSLILGGIIKAVFRKTSFLVVLCSIVSIASMFFVFKYYSPTITIVVPKGYTGRISLILSNVDKDILNVDSNGIGYITKQTFDKVYTEPKVYESDGTNINEQCVGYNPSTFWGGGEFSTIATSNVKSSQKIQFKSFEVVPKDKQGQKQYYYTNLVELVDCSNYKIFVDSNFKLLQNETF